MKDFDRQSSRVFVDYLDSFRPMEWVACSLLRVVPSGAAETWRPAIGDAVEVCVSGLFDDVHVFLCPSTQSSCRLHQCTWRCIVDVLVCVPFNILHTCM